jgi:chitin disaccharide deacetylase
MGLADWKSAIRDWGISGMTSKGDQGYKRGMRIQERTRLVAVCVGMIGLSLGAVSAAEGEAAAIELLVRGDDMGVAQAVNEACIASYRNGIVRSVEVIVPGAWFPDAVQLLKENPGLDVGVHLTLTSEWDRCKWRPLTAAPSLVDARGFFRPMTRQRSDFPPDTGFLEAGPRFEEVERELRAQIELAKRNIANVTHVSAHMGTAVCTPELRALVERLCAEYGLKYRDEQIQYARGFGGSQKSGEEKERDLVKLIEGLQPGRWLIIEHPAYDTPEVRAMGHRGYENVAEDREGVTRAFTSPKVMEAIRRRGIRLIGYGDL